MEITTETILTCPVCGARQKAIMPGNACQHFYECTHCHTILKPKSGDCCVFCSYAENQCPVRQREVVKGPQS
jgi:hypothetical protein